MDDSYINATSYIQKADFISEDFKEGINSTIGLMLEFKNKSELINMQKKKLFHTNSQEKPHEKVKR